MSIFNAPCFVRKSRIKYKKTNCTATGAIRIFEDICSFVGWTLRTVSAPIFHTNCVLKNYFLLSTYIDALKPATAPSPTAVVH